MEKALRNFLTPLTIIALLAVVLMPVALGATDWFAASETMTTGTSDGFGNQQSDDGTTNTKTEADTGLGPTKTLMMLPDGDVSVNWDYEGPTPVGICTHLAGATHHYDRLTCDAGSADAEPDDNASYITAAISMPIQSNKNDQFSLTNTGLGTGTVIVSVQAFMWVRLNQTGFGFGIGLNLNDGAACTMVVPSTPGLAFINRTGTWVNSCDGDVWTVTDLNALQLIIRASTVSDPGSITATYAGVIVTYIELDYELDFLTEWNNVDGQSLTLVAECTTTDADTTLNVLYLAFNWGVIACDGVRNHFALPTDVGLIQVELTSVTTTGDTAQSTVTFDVLILETTKGDGGGGGPGPTDPALIFDFICSPKTRTIECSITLKEPVPGLSINKTSWYLDDAYMRDGRSAGELSHAVSLESFAFPAANKTIRVHVYFSNNQMMTLEKQVYQDNIWLLFLMMFIALVLILFMFYLTFRRRNKRRKHVVVRRDPHAEQRMRIIEGTRRHS